jgi:hypothetical protein
VKQLMPADQDALRLYTAVTQVDGKLADVSADLDPLSISRVFGGRNSLKSDGRWFIDEGFTLGQTAGSPIGVSHPLDGSPGWRQHSDTSFTKDGISFYEKSKAGKFSRIVLSSYNQLYVLSPKSNKSKMLLRSKIFTDSFAFSLAPPTDQASANTKSTEPKYDSRPTAFSKEQGPPLDQAVKAYRSGKASDEDVSNAFHAATRHLPFGKKSVDPWTDKHNCVDIAMATCRAMYPIMPKGTAVGHLAVYNKLGAGHSVNYFSFRDKDGKPKYMLYDQQSGTQSLPHNNIDEASKDPSWVNGTGKTYRGVAARGEWLNDKSIEDSAFTKVEYDGNNSFVDSNYTFEDATPGQPKFNLPAGAVNVLSKYQGYSNRITEIYPKPMNFTPEKPGLSWQAPDGVGVEPIDSIIRTTNFIGIGYIKDGTHGTYRYPEKAEWYKPRSPRQ